MSLQIQGEWTTLYYREGSSDKVYQAAIEPSGEGFVVNIAFGRRGSTLRAGCKTPSPLAYPAARKIYDQIVKEKTAKGYTPGADGTPYQHTDKEQRSTGVLPQRSTRSRKPKPRSSCPTPSGGPQENFDGRRVLIRRGDGVITGINRQGPVIDLPQQIVNCPRRRERQYRVGQGTR
jgi:bifunctional non-homologous end joining protein LigD